MEATLTTAEQTAAFTSTELQKFNVTDAAIAEMSRDYMPLTIAGIDDKQGYSTVHTARMVVKNKRVAVEKVRKELNADAQAHIKAVNGEAKRITDLLEPIESHLAAQQSAIDAEKERIAAEQAAKEAQQKKEAEEREMQRVMDLVKQLAQYGAAADFAMLKSMSPEQFAEDLATAKASHEAETAKKLEDARLAQVEADRLKAERAELDRLRKEQAEREEAAKADQKRIADEQTLREYKIREAQEAIERQQREAQEAARRDAEEAERLRREQVRIQELAEQARVKAIEDARIEADRKQREEEARKAEDARQEALRPDKEKLLAVSNTIVMVPLPDMATEAGKAIKAEVQELLNKIQMHIHKRVKSL